MLSYFLRLSFLFTVGRNDLPSIHRPGLTVTASHRYLNSILPPLGRKEKRELLENKWQIHGQGWKAETERRGSEEAFLGLRKYNEMIYLCDVQNPYHSLL